MDTLTFIAALVKSIAWPITIIGLALLFRVPLSRLIKYILKIKYKDFEISFNQEIDRIRDEIPPQELSDAINKKDDKDEQVKSLAHAAPSKAIIETWEMTELAIYERLKQLFPKDSMQFQRLSIGRAYNELWLTGALPPNDYKILQDLHLFRDRVSNSPEEFISPEVAVKYYELSKYIINKMTSIAELPKVKLTPLTLLAFELTHLLDTGKYNNITIGDIKREIRQGTLLEFLQHTVGNDIDLSIIREGSTYPGFTDFYIEYLQKIVNAYSGNERRKWGIEHSGICLLLAWTIEIIQQGSGWHPRA